MNEAGHQSSTYSRVKHGGTRTAELRFSVGLWRGLRHTNGHRKEVLVCRAGASLLSSIICDTLSGENGLDVHCVDLAEEDALNYIAMNRPDIVVVVCQDNMNPKLNPQEVLSVHPTAKVVVISNQDSRARVYRYREQICRYREEEVTGLKHLLRPVRAQRPRMA